MKKRVLSVILAVLMILALMPVTALAHSGAKDKHSHDWKGGLFTYDDKIIVKTGDSSMGKIYQSEDDSKFNDGDTWHFQAQPGPEYEFVGWTFDNAYLVSSLSDANSPDLSFSYKYDLSFTVGSKFTAKANFDYKSCYSLSTNVSGNGSISKSPDKSLYRQNDQVSLTANADPGWEFTGWTGDVTDSAKSISVTMNSNKSVTANFRALPTYTLNVNTVGEGTVSKDPDAADYWQGRNVKLTANAASGWRFGSWSGSASGTSNPITMSMDGSKDVTATFIKTYNITLNVDGPGKLDSKKAVAGTHDINSTINLDDAKPNANMTCKFIGWRDDATNDYVDSSTFTLTGDRSFTAVFGDREYLYTSAGPNGRLMNDLDGHRARGEEVNLNDAQPTPDAGYTLDCWKEYGYLWSGDGKVVSPIVTIGDSNWFKAYFKVADYKITYDLNGGTVSSNPSSYTYFDNAITLNNPTREGYIFAGWTGTELSGLTSSVTIPKKSSGDRSYTANWTPITYTVAYDKNGGTGFMTSSGYTYGVEQALAANTFTKPGCEFAGWAKSADGPVVYSNTEAVKNLSSTNGATVTLYAKWKVGGIGVSGYDNAYDGKSHSVTVTGDLTDATVTYSTDGGQTYSGTKPEYTNVTAGETVFVKVERTGAAPFVASAVVKISKATLTVSAETESIIYGQTAPLSFTAAYTGFKGTDDVSVLSGAPVIECTSYTAGQDAGDYDISVSEGTLSAQNYTFNCVPGTLSVGKKELTITAANKETVYGQDAPAFTVGYSGFLEGDDETKLGDTLTFVCSYSMGNPVDSYDITPGGLTSKNYDIKFVKGTLTVKPAPLSVTAGDVSVAYGSDAPAFSVTYKGFVNGENESVLGGALSYSCSYAAGSPVKDYSIVPAGLTSGNYTIDFVPGTLTVNKVPLTVTANNETVTFNDAPPAYSVNYSGFVVGEDETDLGGSLTFDSPYAIGSAVGTYSIMPSGLISGNYDISFNPGTLTVDELILTVTFKDFDGTVLDTKQVVYGNAATAPAAPVREGYNFTGWDKTFDAVTGDITVTAQYAIKTYSVTFYQQDGVTPIGLPQTVNWGSAALFETAPAVVGSAFDQWVLTGSDASVTDSLTNVKENIKAVASYIRNGYTVTFVDYQGQVIGTAGVLYGEGAVAPVPPVREGYRFIGWDTSFDNVTGNMTVTAQYAINTYTVRFVNYNGDELSVQTVNWNTAATAPANPTRTGYTFTGWDTAFNAVTGDLVVTAQFRRNAVAAADADDDDDTQNGGTQNGGNTQNDGNQNAPANQQNGDQTLTDEPIPGTSDDGTTTLEDESIPQAQSSVFPWWWILVILAAAGIIWFIIYKRRKDRADAN